MKTTDYSIYFVAYNFIIGVLLMFASEKISIYAGYLSGSYKEKVSRYARTGIFAFGATVAVLMLGVYVFGHLLRV